ncbi:MAG: alpha/beta hydrolase [Deltaproteobacteria bacterium]|nr:alpha/beta hydrolase [Deltaproteobacteria bacterium]MBW2421074.1 alpha/beta hydrolase [Deltaproteobacteria bacterium]
MEIRGAAKSRDGVALVTRSCGQGTPFIWGHCLLGSMAAEDELEIFDWSSASDLARIVRYDARGHGVSEGTDDAHHYSWQHLAEDMLDVVAAEAGEQPAVVGGASMGCATALMAAYAAPERVKGMVLVLPPAAWGRRPAQSRLYHFVSGVVGITGSLPFRVLNLLPKPPGPAASLRGMQRTVMGNLAHMEPEVVNAIMGGAAISDLPLPEKLRTLDVPTLILAWENDFAHPVESAEKLAELLPEASLHVAQEHAQSQAWPGLVREFLGGL